MEERLTYLLAQLDSAVADFERSMAIDEGGLDATLVDLAHNGQAQKFEFTIELFWKTVKVFLLDSHGIDVASPKGAVKKYFELGYVGYDECDALLRALDIRNSMSHVYKKENFTVLHAEIAVKYRGFFGGAITGMNLDV